MVDFSNENFAELAAVDMQASEEQIIKQLMEQCQTVGFLHLKNIEGYSEEEHLKTCKEFHLMPEDVKHKLKQHHHNKDNKNYYRGLSPFLPNDKSHKELYDMGCSYYLLNEEQKQFPLVEETPFPKEQEYKHIQEKFNYHYNLMHSLAMKLISYLAVGLGKEKDFFNKWFEKDSLSTFRSIHYLPRTSGVVDSSQLSEEGRKFTTPEHSDSGFITLLTTFSFPGLQVLMDGEYRSIKPEPGCIVVNLGDTFSRITNFKLKATMHRVLDIGKERFSSPFFFDPMYNAVIPSNCLIPEEEQQVEPIIYGDWLIEKMTKAYVEWKDWEMPPGKRLAKDIIAA